MSEAAAFSRGELACVRWEQIGLLTAWDGSCTVTASREAAGVATASRSIWRESLQTTEPVLRGNKQLPTPPTVLFSSGVCCERAKKKSLKKCGSEKTLQKLVLSSCYSCSEFGMFFRMEALLQQDGTVSVQRHQSWDWRLWSHDRH